MFDRIRRLASSANLRALTANSIPCAHCDDVSLLKYKDKSGTLRTIVSTDNTQTLAAKILQGVAPVALAAATLALVRATHDGVFVIVNIAAGSTITLPAATGSGATYRVIVGTSLTSGSLIVNVANASDFMRGFAFTLSGATASSFATANTGTVATESDTFTMNRTTTGLATIGDFIELVDIAPNVWAVEATYQASGTAASPFSVAV